MKIKILLFVILARVNVTKKNTTLKANTPHEGGITWQPGPFHQSRHKDAYKKYPGLLGRKITKPIREQTSGKEMRRGIRRTATETIGNVAQSKRPGMGSRGIITSEFVNKWGIIGMGMDCLPR